MKFVDGWSAREDLARNRSMSGSAASTPKQSKSSVQSRYSETHVQGISSSFTGPRALIVWARADSPGTSPGLGRPDSASTRHV